MATFGYGGSGSGGGSVVKVPYPDLYFDGTSLHSQIGDNSLTGTITSDNGKYQNGFIDFGETGDTAPAVLQNPVNLTGRYTISLWFYKKRSGSDWGSILRQGAGGAGTVNYPMITKDTDDELGVYLASTSTFYSSGYDTTSLEGSATWIHLAVIANGTNSQFFVNGSLVGTASAVVDTSFKEIGAYSSTSDQTFTEGIDELAFWRFELSSSQISEIYNSTTKLLDLIT